VSTVDSKSYRTVVKMISEGQTDPQVLMGAIHGRTVNKYGKQTILRSLTGVINETDIDIISQLVEEIELQQRQRDAAQQKMTSLTKEWFPEQFDNLQTIPGVKERSATSIIAEVGTDMSNFQSPKKLVAWVGLRPRNEESAGKIKSRKITHGNKYLRKTLIECSWAARRTQGSFYSRFSYHQTVVRRKNSMKVQVAVARKMLAAIWFILHDHVPYRDYTPPTTEETSSDIVPTE
jgi:transposase